MKNRYLALVLMLVPAAPLFSQSKTLNQGPNRMELSLDRKDGDTWKAVDPGLVFNNNDRVRFRFKSNFNGYLYVMIQSTSGAQEVLFPRKDTGEQNRIEAGKEYIVPATQGLFRITGPAGHDVLYWIVTPMSLGTQPKYEPLPPPPKMGPVPPSMTPRCDDTIFKARGECVDTSAGPKQVGPSDRLPENLSQLDGAKSRELMFIRERGLSVMASPAPLNGPVMYEFRLAHK